MTHHNSIPIFVISLLDSPRRADILAQCKHYNLSCTFIDAVDGRSGLPPEYEGLVDRPRAKKRLERAITDGEIACALSHRGVYEKMITDTISEAIILEDDAILTDDFMGFYTQQDYKHLNADMVLLYHMNLYAKRSVSVHKRTYYTPLWMPYGAVGYYINMKTARILLSAMTPITYVADWHRDITGMVSVYASVPRIVHHPKQDHTQSVLLNCMDTIHHKKYTPLQLWIRRLSCIRYRNNCLAYRNFGYYFLHRLLLMPSRFWNRIYPNLSPTMHEVTRSDDTP